VIDGNKTLPQIIQEALDEYLEKGVIRFENKKRYDFKSNMQYCREIIYAK
jgi:hypothetical protein